MAIKPTIAPSLSRGFSLIELTVVVGLLSLLSLAIASVLLMSVTTTNRIRTLTKVKQAGNYALDQIQSLLRSAKAITACDNTTNSITIINPDGDETTLSSTDTRLASSSGALTSAYLTPENLAISQWSLVCEPTENSPTLVTVSFSLTDPSNTQVRESPTLHFETAINLRNE